MAYGGRTAAPTMGRRTGVAGRQRAGRAGMSKVSVDVSLTAHERALSEIALSILRAGVGSRLPTTMEIQDRLEVGSGTVQRALRELADRDAVELRTRGHQGTLVESYNPALLWEFARLMPLRLVSTPPGAIESTVVALTLRDQLQRHGVSVEFDFVRGAARRLASIRGPQRAVALLSRGAAHALHVLDDSTLDTLDLGPHTYYRPESLVVLSKSDAGRPRRIARDRVSFDHSTLTRHQFPDADERDFIDCAFPDVPAAILSGKADAGVWHRVVTVIPPELAGLTSAPVRWDQAEDEMLSISHAVLAWPHEHAEIKALLSLVATGSIASEQDNLAALGITDPAVRERIPWM